MVGVRLPGSDENTVTAIHIVGRYTAVGPADGGWSSVNDAVLRLH